MRFPTETSVGLKAGGYWRAEGAGGVAYKILDCERAPANLAPLRLTKCVRIAKRDCLIDSSSDGIL